MNRTPINFDELFAHLQDLRIPGLSIREKEFSEMRDTLCKDMAVFLYKQQRPLIWAVFTGGTGTGKSSLFNSLCGSSISRVGMERPTTAAPVVYIHENNSLDAFPLPDFRIEYAPDGEGTQTNETDNGRRLIVVTHNRDDLEHIVLVDNPDLDSLEHEHRRIAEDLDRLSDVIIFVASQEKYADEIPSRTLDRIDREGKPCFFLFNKADPAHTSEEIVDFFRQRGITINRDRLWFIPYIPTPSLHSLSGQNGFARFSECFFETLRKETSVSLLIEQKRQRRAHLKRSIDSFHGLAERENKAGERWLGRLDQLFKEQGSNLFEQFEAHFKRDSQNHIQREIKNIYNRYDILSKPRHYLKQLFLVPLRLLGLRENNPGGTSRKVLLAVKKQADITPILSTMSGLNRLVLENLSPEDNDSSLFSELHRHELPISDQEVRDRIGQLQGQLMGWLEARFRDLARGIPKHKEVGIYSTAILWG
ncbi:MAG TPA: 50S ribosome-binding GTPase, partial [Syntrophales bacterium]|nr:50S ribosome-binding GTPase [Syntrophales bacterium]